MASLVLGAIGGYFFGPIGFMAGSALGAMIDPAKSEGPKMNDLHLQGSSYGEPIAIDYGTMRLAGKVICAPPLVPHKNVSGGKGSGPQVTTWSYTAPVVDVQICESDDAHPASKVIGVQKIWANSTLIYDDTGEAPVDNSSVPVTIYLGDEDQQPDPAEEAILGVGNVPAYRGVCRCVFTDWDMAEWGNAIPTLTFQVFTKAGEIPVRVSTFSAWNPPTTSFHRAASYADGVITTTTLTGFNPAGNFCRQQWTIDGTEVGTQTQTTGPQGALGAGVINLAGAYWVAGGSDHAWFYSDPDQPENLIRGITTSGGSAFGNINVYMHENIYAVDGLSDVIARFAAVGGVPGQFINAVALGGPYSQSSIMLGTSDTGDLYVMYNVGTPGTRLWKFDSALNLIHMWDVADTIGTDLRANGNFFVYKNLICFKAQLARFGGASRVCLVKIDPDALTLSNYGTPLASANTVSQNFTVNLVGCLGMDEVGVFSLCPPAEPIPLSEIVADQSDRCGLATSQYNVVQLTPLVPGFLQTRQASGKDNLMQLRTAYFWDAVESSGCMRFVLRGGPSLITIPDNDLAAQAGSAGLGPALVTVKRAQEVDLPATMYVVYFNPEADYQNNTQYSRRLVTNSQANARVDLSIALLDPTARSISAKLLWTTWLERTSGILTTSRQYLWYEPTDIITAHGYVLRITGKNTIASNVVRFDGVVTNTGVFVNGPLGVPWSGFDPPIITIKLPTDLLLLDMPLAIDADLENGIYAAAAGAAGPVGAVWPGYTLEKSSDGGASYASVGSSTTPTPMGVAATALGDFASGNIFDELNSVHVVIGPGEGELTSQSELAVLNGANMAVLGLEWLQFKTATLTAPGEYDLTGLLRGRRGSEWAMNGHTIGERFALAPFLDAPLLFAELSLPRLYKPVSIGSTLAATAATTFTSMGAALQPYAPVSLGGGSDDIGDTTLQWIRRTRKGGAWADFVDVPVSEAVEQFIVQIWDASYTLCARIITVTNAETTVYTAAQQIADFGAAQETIYFTVGQIGAYTLGTQARGTAMGGGVTNDAPLVPIAPYNAPPAPVPGPTNPVNVVMLWNGSNSPHHTSGVVVGDVYVVEFTTDANPVGPGNIDVGEYGDPATYRYAVISTDTGGTAILPNGTQYGNSVSFLFGAGAGQVNLSAFTTYYLVVRMPSPPSVLGDNCDMVISF